MDKDKLVERCEDAAVPSFALFAEAFEAIHGGRSSLGLRWSEFCSFVEAEAWLDAAMKLVPEGACVEIGNWEGDWGRVFLDNKAFLAEAKNLPLALCAAALRSHAPK